MALRIIKRSAYATAVFFGLYSVTLACALALDYDGLIGRWASLLLRPKTLGAKGCLTILGTLPLAFIAAQEFTLNYASHIQVRVITFVGFLIPFMYMWQRAWLNAFLDGGFPNAVVGLSQVGETAYAAAATSGLILAVVFGVLSFVQSRRLRPRHQVAILATIGGVYSILYGFALRNTTWRLETTIWGPAPPFYAIETGFMAGIFLSLYLTMGVTYRPGKPCLQPANPIDFRDLSVLLFPTAILLIAAL
jgi:hypothetical protein